MSSFTDFFAKYSDGVIRTLQGLDVKALESFCNLLISARKNKKRIYVIGNGGSAATASHLCNDFSKRRFSDDNSLFRVMSLTDNLSWISAIGNDEGYEHIFSSQLQSHLDPGDLVIAISSSGNSPNVLKALTLAKDKKATSVAIVGFGGGKAAPLADLIIDIPSKKGQYGYMEDVTLIINHILSIYIYEQDQKTFK